MGINTIRTGMQWVDSIEQVEYFQSRCAQEQGCWYKHLVPQNQMIPSQAIKTSNGATVAGLRILDTKCMVVLDLASDIGHFELIRFAHGDYFIYRGQELSSLMPEGYHFAELTDSDGLKKYSQVFYVNCEGATGNILTNGSFSGFNGWVVGSGVNAAVSQEDRAGAPTYANPSTSDIVVNIDIADNQIYTWSGSVWVPSTPSFGQEFLVLDQGNYIRFNGSGWQSLSSPPISGTGGSVCFNGTVSPTLTQPGLFTTSGESFTVTVTVTGMVSGSLDISLGGGSSVSVNSNGASVLTAITGSSADLVITPSGGFDGCFTIQVEKDGNRVCLSKLEWSNCGVVGGIHYPNNDNKADQFSNSLFLPFGVEPHSPEFFDEVEEEEDSAGNVTEVGRRTVCRHKMFIDYVPEYLAKSLSLIGHHSDVTWTDKDGNVYKLSSIQHEIDPEEVEGNCLTSATLTFEMDDPVNSAACCEVFSPPCLRSCAEVHGSNTVPETGGPTVGNYYVIDGSKEIALVTGPPATFNNQPCVDGVVTGSPDTDFPDSYFNEDDSEWQPVAVLTLTGGDELCKVNFTGDVMDRYRARLQYSMDLVTWFDSDYDLTAADWVNGTGDKPVLDAWPWVRLKVYSDDCIIGYSNRVMNHCCVGQTMKECAYYQDIRVAMGVSTLADLEVYSFEVNSVEQMGDPVPVGTSFDVIQIDGVDFVTNLIDVLNDIAASGLSEAVSCFKFYPHRNLRNDVVADNKGGYFRIRYPSTSNFTIKIRSASSGTDQIRFTQSVGQQWDGGSWVGYSYSGWSFENAVDCFTES